MAYFVTGATGFIGRHLVQCLLRREGDIYLLVRKQSRARLDVLIEQWGAGAQDRCRPVLGDLTRPRLGVSSRTLGTLRRAGVEHFFHLAAVYDMTADEGANQVANVDGTRNAIALANALPAGRLHHASSIAVAGMYKGLFTEEMFDEGQRLEHPYHRTKFEAEQLVRTDAGIPWRVYRPSIVVGNSQTGEMDKIDGPYYFFPLIKTARHYLPTWLPLFGPELGRTNIVPVDYVARAIDHLAHEPGLDGRAFHLANPNSQRSSEVLDIFARAAHAPRFSLRLDAPLVGSLPKRTLSMVMGLPGSRVLGRAVLGELGIPEEVLGYVGLTATFDTRQTEEALTGTGIEVPPLESYAERLWDYWERSLDPELFRDPSFAAAVAGKTVLITGASSGIGKAAALKVARGGGIPILVARGTEKLEQTKLEIERGGGTAFTYSADLSNLESVERLIAHVLAEHEAVDVLVNNAGRSIRRSIALSYDRFHDFERTIQLNYLGAIKLILGLLPVMRARRSGHIINISSIGVQTNPPRFSAYVASKAALDAWTRVVASETISDNVHFTTIHMPLVRTPMIAPTKIYDSFPTISPEEAADLIAEAIRSRPKHIGTRLGTFGEVSYALFPKAVDRILATAYKVFPDSAAARGEKDVPERASTEQVAMAHLMRGVHW